MSINALSSEILSICAQSWNGGGRFSTFIPKVASNLNKIAIPVMAMIAFANLPGVYAGPLEYAACVTGCTLFLTPAAVPGCLTACGVVLFLPTP